MFGGGSSPTKTSDNLFSTDLVEVLLGISEGPIKGLADGGKSYFIGDTPLLDPDGNSNFDQFELIVRKGSELGETITSRMGGFGTSTAVGTNLAYNTPVIRSGLHTNINYLDVRLVINQLFVQNDNGTFENTGKIKIEYRKHSDSDWTPVSTSDSNPPPSQILGDFGAAFYGLISSLFTSPSPGDKTTYWDDTEPVSTDKSAIWFDSSNDNKPYQLVSGTWTAISGASLTDGVWTWPSTNSWGQARTAKAVVSATPPATIAQGDYWLNTGDSVPYFFNGSTWIVAGGSLAPGKFGSNGTGGTVITAGDGELIITGKTTQPFVKEFRFPVDSLDDDTYDLRVTKMTPEDTTESFFDVTWDSFQEVTGQSFNFPGLSTTQLTARASDQFSSIPDFSGVYEGRLVKIPSNYDPVERTYTGVWDGTWKIDYTDNPAFIVQDLNDNDRYGLNAYYPVTINKWDVYAAGQWCDTITADGTPRFTFNMLLSDPQGCREAIDYICGVFGGRYFDDGNGSATIKIDGDSNAVAIFAPENIVDGVFTYSFTEIQTRYNDVNVAFINPDLNWQEDHRRVFDQDHINLYGSIPLNFTAVGCTNVAEAIRRAKYKLVTGISETTIVTFKTNRVGLYVDPYDIILIADPTVDSGFSGRLKSVIDDTTVEFRDPVFFETGINYKILFQIPASDDSGTFTVEERDIATGTSGSKTTITVTVGLPDLPEKAVFAIQKADGTVAPQAYRISSITEEDGDPDNVTIQAIQVNRQKWEYIDGTVGDIDDVLQYKLSVNDRPKPVPVVRLAPSVSANGARVVNNIALDWDPSPSVSVMRYRIYVSKDNGPSSMLGETANLHFEWQDIPPGEYLFGVTAVNVKGLESDLTFIEHRFVGDYRDVSPVTNLRVVNEPEEGVFNTKAPTVVWTPVSTPDHAAYVVWVTDMSDVLLRETVVTDAVYTYEFQDNQADNGGTAVRQFKIKVANRDQFGGLSPFVSISLNNPAPAAPTIGAVGIGRVIKVAWPAAEEADYAGSLVWIETTSTFDPATTTPKFDGLANTYSFQGDYDTTYYVRVANYDTLSKADVNASGIVSATTESVEGLNQEIQNIVGPVMAQIQAKLRDHDQLLGDISDLITDLSISHQEAIRGVAVQQGALVAGVKETMTSIVTATKAVASLETQVLAMQTETAAQIDTLQTAQADTNEALATLQTTVEANYNSLSAGGIISWVASAGENGALARVTMAVTATDGVTQVLAGQFFEIVSDGLGGFTSRTVSQADQHYWTDGTSLDIPMSYIDGVLTLGTLRFEHLYDTTGTHISLDGTTGDVAFSS